MPRTEVMLIGRLGDPNAGFPGAGGPIPRSFRSPYTQPQFRMNRHMPIPSTYGEPQNLLKVSDKTNYNPRARASGGLPVTSALGAPLFGLGATEDAQQAEAWKQNYMVAAGTVVLLGATFAGIHGYRRNKGSVGYTILWTVAGGLLPVLTNVVSIAQGFGKPAGR